MILGMLSLFSWQLSRKQLLYISNENLMTATIKNNEGETQTLQ